MRGDELLLGRSFLDGVLRPRSVWLPSEARYVLPLSIRSFEARREALAFAEYRHLDFESRLEICE